MARVTVLLNRGGGAFAADPKLPKKVRKALRDAGVEGEIDLVSGRECAVRCRAIAERGDDMLVVGGGDGTVSAAASELVGTGTMLGILPLGTLNHFARDLGIPADVGEAARLIATRCERRVDVGEMNERIFINNSAIGLYPLMVVDRDLQRARLGRDKRLAMIVASLRILIRFNHHRLTLTVNEERTGRVDTPLLFVGNNEYRTDIGAPGSRERLDGGELCVFVLRCYRVTLAPLVIYCTMLWGVGLGGSYLLAYRGLGPWEAMQSPLAFWIMSAAALALTALLFGALLRWTMRRRAKRK